MKNLKEIQTTNYTSLTFYKSNRLVNKKSVKNIKKSMEKYGNITVGVVALVDGVHYILDAQHRFTACTELGIPFRYTLVELDKKTDIVPLIASLNTTGKSWKAVDFLNGWATEGKKAYQWLTECNNDYKAVTLSNILRIFGCSKKTFENGEFKVTRAEYLKATRVVKQVAEIKAILFADGKLSTQPLRAVIDTIEHEKYSHAKMKRSIVNGRGLWNKDETILRTQLFQEVSQY